MYACYLQLTPSRARCRDRRVVAAFFVQDAARGPSVLRADGVALIENQGAMVLAACFRFAISSFVVREGVLQLKWAKSWRQTNLAVSALEAHASRARKTLSFTFETTKGGRGQIGCTIARVLTENELLVNRATRTTREQWYSREYALYDPWDFLGTCSRGGSHTWQSY